MIIKITKTFQDLLDKGFGKYFIDLKKLSEEIKKSFNKKEIYLKRPIIKIKIKINGVDYRIVGLVKGDIILPILIFLKKDKNFGENIIWNKELEILIDNFSIKMQNDLENNKFLIF